MPADNRHLVTVELGERSYPIHIAPGLIGALGALIRPHLTSDKVLVIADEHVAKLHAQAVIAGLTAAGVQAAVATFPPGETHKTLDTAGKLWEACAGQRIDRKDTIIALGGGVCGDLAGFVAAGWMRGIAFIQVPTSLLAMVDSSVGGKTGVNSPAGKNLIGAFKQPSCVVIDPTLLATMDGREYRAGLAEVLKYGVIRDPEFFAWQERRADALIAGDPESVAYAVAASCRIKAWYVAEDETEQGVRAQLNYGHTFGHALERETGYREYLHGEAVAIGMRMAAELAKLLGMVGDGLVHRQDALLKRYLLPLVHRCADPAATAQRLAGHCRLDKKVAAGRTRFILPTGLGSVVLSESPAESAVIAAFRHGLAAG